VSDQAPQEIKDSQATSATETQLPLPSKAAAQPPRQATQKTEESRQLRDADFQKLKQSLGQIAKTRRTTDGVVMTLGEKSIRFDSGKREIAPQYRGILNRTHEWSCLSSVIRSTCTHIRMTSGQMITTCNSQGAARWSQVRVPKPQVVSHRTNDKLGTALGTNWEQNTPDHGRTPLIKHHVNH
jgi:hypothetical protein